MIEFDYFPYLIVLQLKANLKSVKLQPNLKWINLVPSLQVYVLRFGCTEVNAALTDFLPSSIRLYTSSISS